jgi:GNAT superfamily N-acetyltransferase
VARWIYGEFWADKDHHSPESLEALLQQASRPDVVPLSLLALAGDTPVGTANLVENDDEARPHLRPWLAALFVQPGFRKRGIGSLLVRNLRDRACRLGLTGMYLGTDQPAFYERLGAIVVERLAYDFCIMYLAARTIEGVAQDT